MKEFVVEDAQEQHLCFIKDTTAYGGNFTTLEAQIPDDTGVTVSIHSFDHSGARTLFEVNGLPFAEMHLIENNNLPALSSRGLNRSLWKLRVAGGTDMALVLALAMCRVETLHVWAR